MARVIVKDSNFKNATLTKQHQHLPSKLELCKTKCDSKIDKVCNERKFITTRDAYLDVRTTIANDDVQYLPERKSYASRVHRIKRKFEPKKPHSFEEFEELINDEKYKKRYRSSWSTFKL